MDWGLSSLFVYEYKMVINGYYLLFHYSVLANVISNIRVTNN